MGVFDMLFKLGDKAVAKIAEKLLATALYNKFGEGIGVNVEKFAVKVVDGKVTVSAAADFNLESETAGKLVEKMVLGGS